MFLSHRSHDRKLSRVLATLEATLDPEAVVLYGPGVTSGSMFGGSWDLAVVSSRFEGLNRLERFTLLAGLVGPGDMEIRACTPKELATLDQPFLQELVRTGLPVRDDGTFEAVRSRRAQAA